MNGASFPGTSALDGAVEVQPTELSAADEAHLHHESLLSAKTHTGNGFLWMGRELAWMLDHQGWEPLGHESFEGYCGSPEVGLQRTQAFKLVMVYRETAKWALPDSLREELPAIGVEKLALICRAVKQTGGDPESWVHEAKALSMSDLEETIGSHGVKSTHEDEEAADRAKEHELSALLSEATIQSLSFGKYLGLTLHVLTDGGPRVIRAFGRRGLSVEVR